MHQQRFLLSLTSQRVSHVSVRVSGAAFQYLYVLQNPNIDNSSVNINHTTDTQRS